MRLTLALTTLLATASCATITESRFNPLTWFGPSETVATSTPRDELRPLVVPGNTTQVIDNRTLIAQVTALRVDPTPSGAIVTAEGIAAGAGYFNAQLVRRSVENGVLTLEFRAEAPTEAVTAPSRAITVATQLDSADLVGIRTIAVVGTNGARQVSR